MELNDLRRQWQQSGELPAAPQEVTALLRRRSTSLAEKMRRNAWLEAGFTGLLTLIIPFVIATTHTVVLRLESGLLLFLLLLLLYYYYRKLGLLRRMEQPEVQVRTHLAVLCAGLRQLLRFYYWLSVAMLPVMLSLVLGFAVGKMLARSGAHHWARLVPFASGLLVGGALLQVAIVNATRWWVQHLYGQHLDHLENQLHELDKH